MVCVAAKDKNSIILPIAKEPIEPPSTYLTTRVNLSNILSYDPLEG
jgi:hypothetical protein